MTRYDGKGFHPTVRPQIPHRKRERTKLKVFRRILPKAWQLSMMKLGIRFVALESDRFESVELSSCESALLESICVEIGCIGSGTWYVDTNGCGMLQADQANPPPQKGFARKALNWVMVFFMNIGKVLSLAGLMALANACGKDPEPTPTPTPEPTQIEPTYPDTVYVPFEWNMENHNIDPAKNPNIDTIRFYATKPQVKKIVMLLLPADNPYYSSGWDGAHFIGHAIPCMYVMIFVPKKFAQWANLLQLCLCQIL